MAYPTMVAGYLALFALVGVLFVFVNLLIGKLIRPKLPNVEKQEIYECGEPTIGSSFVQFDLRFYVVALLFIIFDVEVAFFFPWATVFGKATHLMDEDFPVVAAAEASADPAQPAVLTEAASARLYELGVNDPQIEPITAAEAQGLGIPADTGSRTGAAVRSTARRLAVTSFADIGVFFGVLLVGFAYVWKRGDLDWVRAMQQERGEVMLPGRPVPTGTEREIVISV
jgi:NADH-quinone oxidoreductase subunit A